MHLEDIIITAPPPFHRAKRLAQGHTKIAPGFHVTTLPTPPTGPLCLLWRAPSLASSRHSIVVPLFFSPEPAAQALATRPQGRRRRPRARPYSGTGGCSSLQVMQTVSLPRPQPLWSAPTWRGNTRPRCVPTTCPPIRSLFTPTGFGHLLPTTQAQGSQR